MLSIGRFPITKPTDEPVAEKKSHALDTDERHLCCRQWLLFAHVGGKIATLFRILNLTESVLADLRQAYRRLRLVKLIPTVGETDQAALYRRYQELQAYVGPGETVARAAGSRQRFVLHPLIDDFYAEIERHADARKVITGGQSQIDRLKGTLVQWLRELLAGPYDQHYVARRWQVGWRHVESGSTRFHERR